MLCVFFCVGKENMFEWGSGDLIVGGGDVLCVMFEVASCLLDLNLEDSVSLYAVFLLC